MQHLLDDVEHFAKIVSGCESINNLVNNGVALDADGRYAQSVLRLHAQDELGAIAGNESLLDGIKKGAKNTKEWIIAFFKALKNFITGGYGKVKTSISSMKNKNKVEAAAAASKLTTKLNAAHTVLSNVQDYAGNLKQNYYKEIGTLNETVSHAATLSKHVNQYDVQTLADLVSKALEHSKKLSDMMAVDWNRNVEKADETPEGKKEYMLIGRAGVDVGRALGYITEAIAAWSEALPTEDKE